MKTSKKNTPKISKNRSDPLNKDLSGIFNEKGWKKVKFELRPKDKSITIRLSEDMLMAIKAKADEEGLDYQKWIRSSIEDALNRIA